MNLRAGRVYRLMVRGMQSAARSSQAGRPLAPGPVRITGPSLALPVAPRPAARDAVAGRLQAGRRTVAQGRAVTGRCPTAGSGELLLFSKEGLRPANDARKCLQRTLIRRHGLDRIDYLVQLDDQASQESRAAIDGSQGVLYQHGRKILRSLVC